MNPANIHPTGTLLQLVSQWRWLRSMLTLIESGDGLIGATHDSLTTQARLRADAASLAAEIINLNGQKFLKACPRCDGRGIQQSTDLEPPPCPRCKGSGYANRKC